MPKIIIKADPSHDLYIEWTTVADGPTAVGSRDEITYRGSGVNADRLARTDATGTSAFDGYGGWDHSGFVYMQIGWLPRQNLLAMAQLLTKDPNADIEAAGLLEPFEDDDDE